MATQVQIRRGTTIQNLAFTGVEGELTYDTQIKRLRVHDGLTVGGTPVNKNNGDTMTGQLSFSGSTHPGIRLNNLTTLQRNALAAAAGMTIWNINTNRLEVANQALTWITHTKLAGDTMTGLLQFSGVTHAGVRLNNLTTAERDAIAAPTDGMIIFNTTTGQFEGYDSGWGPISGGGSSPPFVDTTALVMGSADPTKLLRFEVDGFTAATTRVLTPQNSDYTIAGINIEQTFTANQHIGALNVLDLNTDGSIYAATGGFTVAANGDVGIVSQVTLGAAGVWSDVGGVFNFAGEVIISPVISDVTPLSLLGYSLTGASTVPILLMDGIWNTAGSPTAIFLGISNTASGASSLFLDFRLSGISRFDIGKFGNTTITYTGIGATPTDGLTLQNTTAAAVGAQQYSPALRFSGRGWKTNAVAGSQTTDWRLYNQPVQGSASPLSNFLIDVSINGGAFLNLLALSSAGGAILTGALQLSGNLNFAASGLITWASRSRVGSSADGIIELFNTAQTGFTRLNFGGVTSSFPAITRSGAAFILTLADGTGSAAITTGNHTMTTAALLSINSGTNQRAGNAVLVAGTVTVANTTVTANTIVLLTRKTSGGTIGTAITYTVTAATSFTINSDSALDTSTFSYMLIEVP